MKEQRGALPDVPLCLPFLHSLLVPGRSVAWSPAGHGNKYLTPSTNKNMDLILKRFISLHHLPNSTKLAI